MSAVLELPQYLTRPQPSAVTYGELRYVHRETGDLWMITGDPQVAQLAKRLFPGSEGVGSGTAKFPANRRTFGDLVWLMHRWPLRILERDLERWETAYKDACEHTLTRQELNRELRPIKPPAGGWFKGTLDPYQEEALGWCLSNRRTLLGDDTGLGKTVVGLAHLATVDRWPAVVIPQPHMVGHWRAKSAEFLHTAGKDGPLFDDKGLRVHVIRGLRPSALPQADIYILHYLLVRAWVKELLALKPVTVLMDEIQELRHSGSAKYSAASLLASSAENCIGLSATPIYGRGGEIWNVMNIIDFHCLGDWDSFTREWCESYGSDVVKDPEKLGAFLRQEGLMLRRTKEQVRQQLPPKRRVVEPVDGDEHVFNELIQEAVRHANQAAELPVGFARGRAEQRASAAARLATGVSKAPACAAFIAGLLEVKQPTIVYAWHHAVFDILREQLKAYNPVFITGRETPKQKEAAQAAFENDETDVILISLRAATGIDGLQYRAENVVFAELDWSPGIHKQGEDRGNRRGAEKKLMCYYLVSEFGADPDMQANLGLKVAQLTGIMGDAPESEEDRALAQQHAREHMKNILTKLRKMEVRHVP